MFLDYRREQNEPDLSGATLVEARVAEIAQQGAAQDFPGLVARAHIATTEQSLVATAVENLVLGWATFAYICSQAKRGLCRIIMYRVCSS